LGTFYTIDNILIKIMFEEMMLSEHFSKVLKIIIVD
jgi:hypothetical protein